MNTLRIRYRLLLPGFAAAALLAGCNREDGIQSYNVPKDQGSAAVAQTGIEPSAAPAAGQLPPGHPVIPDGNGSAVSATPVADTAAPAAGEPTWTVPAKWKSLPLGMMDFARFATSDAAGALPVTVTSARGSMLSNVNRWEGQLGLAPTPEADLPKVLHESKVNDTQVFELDLKSGDGRRMLVMVVPTPSTTWFFKLTGPAEQITTIKPDFDAFTHSVKFGDAGAGAASSTPAPAPPSRPTPLLPVQPQPTLPVAPSSTASNAPFTYTTPTGWAPQPVSGAGAMGIRRVAALTITNDTGKAEVTVIPLAAGSGDLAANIDRWRGQVGLPPGGEAYQPKAVMIDGVSALLIDLTGPAPADGKAKRMIMAIRSDTQTSWFFKIIGPADVVTPQQDAFAAFLASVKFKPAQ